MFVFYARLSNPNIYGLHKSAIRLRGAKINCY
jgi:hypothetical protein